MTNEEEDVSQSTFEKALNLINKMTASRDKTLETIATTLREMQVKQAEHDSQIKVELANKSNEMTQKIMGVDGKITSVDNKVEALKDTIESQHTMCDTKHNTIITEAQEIARKAEELTRPIGTPEKGDISPKGFWEKIWESTINRFGWVVAFAIGFTILTHIPEMWNVLSKLLRLNP
jgi:hypothetical protein